jgi:hypothetical protein
MATHTPQPSPPHERDGKWFFTYHKLTGPEEIGPYDNEAAALKDFEVALRIHAANGYTDGPINSVIN